MKKILSSEQLIEKTAERPYIRGTSSPYLLSSVVVVRLFLEVDGQSEHLW